MTFQLLIFAIFVGALFVNLGVQAYIHFEAYPLIPFVGKSEFAAYIAEYEKRLMIPLLAPYAISLLANLILIFTRPDGVSVVLLIIILLVNLAVSVVTLQMATPPYNKIKQAGMVTVAGMAELMQINMIRLILTAVCALLAIFLIIAAG